MYEYPSRTKLTIKEIESFPLCEDGKQVTIYDTTLPGFALRIGKTAKTFIVYKRVAKGAPKRITIGKYGQLTLDAAKVEAKKRLADLSVGVDPTEERKALKEAIQRVEAKNVQTVEWVLNEYTTQHIVANKGGKKGTLDGIEDCRAYFGAKSITLLKQEGDTWKIDRQAQLSDWLNRPFREITRDEVLNRFNMFSLAKPKRVQKATGLQPICRTHQLSFKYMSSAFNFVTSRYELDIKENLRNPFDVLKAHNKWKKSKVRERMLEFRKEEFSLWWKAANDYRNYNPVASDYILFSLVQVGRSIDIAPLKWSQVDLDLEEVKYLSTKNGKTYTFPLTKLALEIIKRRKEFAINEFVFGYEDSKTGHIPQDSKTHFINIGEACGKVISHHDLRRTWGTDSMFAKVDERPLNFCLKHSMNDVNEHYLMQHYDLIKEALQSVEDYLVAQAEKFKSESTILRAVA
jgi:integrase